MCVGRAEGMAEGSIVGVEHGWMPTNLAWSETCSAHGHTLRGNREVPATPATDVGSLFDEIAVQLCSFLKNKFTSVSHCIVVIYLFSNNRSVKYNIFSVYVDKNLQCGI